MENEAMQPLAECNIIKQAVKTYGEDAQLWMVIEEMSELAKEICKRKRGKKNYVEIADEIADVCIMIEQLKYICGIPEKMVQERIDFKIERLRERLEELKKWPDR